MPDLEISRALVLSTAHLPDKFDGPGPCDESDVFDFIVDTLPYGWRLYVGCDEPDASEFGVLESSVRLARSVGCRWLEFDRDGDIIDTLPQWNDEEPPGPPMMGCPDCRHVGPRGPACENCGTAVPS